MVNISTLALHSNQPIMADLSVLGTGIIETELLVACTLFSSIIIFFWFIFSLQPLRFVQKTYFKCSLQITLKTYTKAILQIFQDYIRIRLRKIQKWPESKQKLSLASILDIAWLVVTFLVETYKEKTHLTPCSSSCSFVS